MGVKNAKKWTEEENKLLSLNYQSQKKQLLILFPNRSAAAINIQASKLGLSKIHNEYCESDTSVLLLEIPETYYWIGFILADGHISNHNRLSIALAKKDSKHLEKFCTYLSCKNLKIDKKNSCRLSVKDNVYIKQLKEKFDIKNDKTYYPPNLDWNIDKNLFLSMLIGYIDGDGCIKYQFQRKDASIAFHVHSSWLFFLQLLKSKLFEYFNFNTGEPIIGKDGYARWTISNFELVKELKRFVINMKLPFLDRKWSRINLNYISRTETSRERDMKVIQLYNGIQYKKRKRKFKK